MFAWTWTRLQIKLDKIETRSALRRTNISAVNADDGVWLETRRSLLPVFYFYVAAYILSRNENVSPNVRRKTRLPRKYWAKVTTEETDTEFSERCAMSGCFDVCIGTSTPAPGIIEHLVSVSPISNSFIMDTAN